METVQLGSTIEVNVFRYVLMEYVKRSILDREPYWKEALCRQNFGCASITGRIALNTRVIKLFCPLTVRRKYCCVCKHAWHGAVNVGAPGGKGGLAR